MTVLIERLSSNPTEADISRILEMYEEHYGRKTTVERLKANNGSDTQALLVARNGKTIVGFAVYVHYFRMAGKVASLQHIVVVKADRRRGIGSSLFQEFLDRARHADCENVQLVSNDTDEANNLYRKFQLKECELTGFWASLR